MNSNVRQDYEKLITLVSKYFSVRLRNDWINNPNQKRHDELLYDYSYGKTIVGYLYYRIGKSDEYASFEYNPKYLGNESVNLSNFEVAPIRKSFPQAKLIFRSFDEVERDLENICKVLFDNLQK